MTHLRLVPPSPSSAPEPAMPRAYAPPAPARGFPYPSGAFASHGARLAPSRLYPDRLPAPPGGRAHVTENPSDLDFEQAVIIAMERLAAGRELRDGLGRPVDKHEIQRYAGLSLGTRGPPGEAQTAPPTGPSVGRSGRRARRAPRGR